jgi:hypothetical protein
MTAVAPTEDEILRIVEPRFGSPDLARRWFDTEPLPGFNGATARQLVAAGRGQWVLEYIAAVDAGIFA